MGEIVLLEDMDLSEASKEDLLRHISSCHHELRQLRKNCFTFSEVKKVFEDAITLIWARKHIK